MCYLNKINIEVVPSTTPKVIRPCGRCGRKMPFASSGSFRVNANRNLIDVWLIYHCCSCNSTWNMAIYERTDIRLIPKKLYERFLSNDRQLADNYAFQCSKSGYSLTWHQDNLLIKSSTLPDVSAEDNIQEYIISCPLPVHIRTDKLLCQLMNISRSSISTLLVQGAFLNSKDKDFMSKRVCDGMVIYVNTAHLSQDEIHSYDIV